MSPRPVTGTHWLRENARETSPRRVLIADTEAVPTSAADLDHQVLRLWSARLLRRRGIDPRKPRHEDYDGTTADELVDLIESLARADASLWVLTHNLNYDLAVTALPVLLTERGWRITEGALTAEDPWLRLSRRSHRMTITDSWSYLPLGVEQIGRLVGLRKLELPDWNDSEADWRARCQRDVAIVAKAMSQLLDWWDAGGYGNWSVTGPATGWSSFRHRRPPPRVLVDPDPEARALEARAITGGRRTTRRVGRQPLGLYADLDMPTAHLVAMSEQPLPFRRDRRFDTLPLDHRWLRSRIYDVLAECEVEVDRPRYPWRSSAGILYPVGRFHTVLAGPELRSALERGELRSIGRGYAYLTGTYMREWSLWLAGLLDPEHSDAPPAARLAAKAWSRSVPGKWAGHTSEVISRVPDPRPGWQVERGFLANPQRPADFLTVGGELWTIIRDLWADDAFPAVLAFVQSYTRLALNAMLDAAGDAALSCNTDGAILDVRRLLADQWPAPESIPRGTSSQLAAADLLARSWDPELAPFTARVKAAWSDLRIISPQHLVTDGTKRLAGIPARAQQLAGGLFRFTAWPRLHVQLRRPGPPAYRTQRRTVDLSNVPAAGWLTTNGDVIPPLVAPGPNGDLVLAPHWDLASSGDTLEPVERQHPALRAAMHRLPWQDPRTSPQESPHGPETDARAS